MAIPFVNEAILFIRSHLLLIILFLLVFFLGYKFIKSMGKAKPVIINRKEIERKYYLERNKFNLTDHFKYLYRGFDCLGKIKLLRYTSYKNQQFMEITIEPLFLNLTFLKVINPLGKSSPLIIKTDRNITETNNQIISRDPLIAFDIESQIIRIKPSIQFDFYAGIYYDTRMLSALEYIEDKNIVKTDLDNLSADYFKYAQEQATINPEYAHEVLQKQQEIDLEEKKRLHRTT